MSQHLPILVAGFALALVLTPLSRYLALKIDLVARPREQRLHRTTTPLMGGLAIYGALVLTLLIFGLPAHFVELGAILAGATLMALLGLWDDRHELAPKVKFAGQIAAAGVLVSTGVRVRMFDNLPLLDAALTIFWVVGLTNALNFQDNMDGLAISIAAIASSFFLILAVMEGQYLVGSLAAALCGASAGFFIYNFNPANTFMGDMGSMVLGFTLAVLGIKLRFSGPLSVTWMIPIIVLGLPIFDTTLVIFTRLREGRSPAQGGKDHSSHRLMRMGLGQRSTLAVLCAICIALGGAAVAISRVPSAGWAIGGVLAVLAAAAFGFLEWHYIKHHP